MRPEDITPESEQSNQLLIETLPPEILEIILLNFKHAELQVLMSVSMHIRLNSINNFFYTATSSEAALLSVFLDSVACLGDVIEQYDFDVDSPIGENDETLLHYVVRHQRLDCCQYLLAYGASPCLKNKNGIRPFDIAVDQGDPRFIDLLLAWVDGNGNSLLHHAVFSDDPKLVQLLVTEGADIEEGGKYGQTALHTAVMLNLMECTLVLLANDANVNVADDSGSTPLHIAAANNSLEFVEKLYIHCADINQTTYEGVTPLAFAAVHSSKKVMRKLLSYGASMYTSNARGDSALHSAAFFGCVESMGLLLKAGIDPNVQNQGGMTALHNAVLMKKVDGIRILLAYGARTDIQNCRGATPFDLADDMSLNFRCDPLVFLALLKSATVARGSGLFVTCCSDDTA